MTGIGGAMTDQEYGTAYTKGYKLTMRFLISRGLYYESAEEITQEAWARGWERLTQLRDPQLLFTWVNTIALNIYRSYMRREPFMQQLDTEVRHRAAASQINESAIDLRRVLPTCNKSYQVVLKRHYIDGCPIWEMAQDYGCTETAIRVRMLRARRAVGKMLAA
jgi:RNA polymerase sigma-70 factor (ECF subfamily)